METGLAFSHSILKVVKYKTFSQVYKCSHPRINHIFISIINKRINILILKFALNISKIYT